MSAVDQRVREFLSVLKVQRFGRAATLGFMRRNTDDDVEMKENTQNSSEGAEQIEPVYSRKVFVGGVPQDITEEKITKAFSQFGPHKVDWPTKKDSNSVVPPKGFVFILFRHDASIQKLMQVCMIKGNNFYYFLSSDTQKNKLVQVRFWKIADCECIMNPYGPFDAKKTIFVGGIPRSMKASELGQVLEDHFGPVSYVGIDIDAEYKYPRGSGHVDFISQQSYIDAINQQFCTIENHDVFKRVELKPFVLQDSLCDACSCRYSRRRKPAPYFCPNPNCLQYYCKACWATAHDHLPNSENHRPMIGRTSTSSSMNKLTPFKGILL